LIGINVLHQLFTHYQKQGGGDRIGGRVKGRRGFVNFYLWLRGTWIEGVINVKAPSIREPKLGFD